ncbi:MAG TPA: hypothetical protein DCY35_03785 [Prolixibacteraceae bacterium]|nr:hypothetical protein [Prolixibacteraceae bacterium]
MAELLSYAYMALLALVNVFMGLVIIFGSWHGFVYEIGKPGSKFHIYYQLYPLKRFFNRKKMAEAELEMWVKRAVGATMKGFSDWQESENCRVRYTDSLVDITDRIEIYTRDEDIHSLRESIRKRLEDSGIKWTIQEDEKV